MSSQLSISQPATYLSAKHKPFSYKSSQMTVSRPITSPLPSYNSFRLRAFHLQEWILTLASLKRRPRFDARLQNISQLSLWSESWPAGSGTIPRILVELLSAIRVPIILFSHGRRCLTQGTIVSRYLESGEYFMSILLRCCGFKRDRLNHWHGWEQ